MKNSRKDRISYFSDFRLCVSVTKKKKYKTKNVF